MARCFTFPMAAKKRATVRWATATPGKDNRREMRLHTKVERKLVLAHRGAISFTSRVFREFLHAAGESPCATTKRVTPEPRC